jgi:hypothetical protein
MFVDFSLLLHTSKIMLAWGEDDNRKHNRFTKKLYLIVIHRRVKIQNASHLSV